MLKIFLSSTSRDLEEFRKTLLDEIGKSLEGVGMESFVPRGERSQKDSIDYLKKCQVVIFLITPYYGSLMESCTLKESCKADCTMKTSQSQISFTHCEYKTTIAENICHQTYIIEKDWDIIDYLKNMTENEFNAKKIKILEKFHNISLRLLENYYKVREYADALRKEVSKEAYGRIKLIQIPETVDLIKRNLADQVIEWHRDNELDFTTFVNREKKLNEIIDNIDGKIEVWGVGGVGKTALIEVALLIQKLKGKKILTIGTPKTYASGSGFKDFRDKSKEEQYIGDSPNQITIYDIINAFTKVKLIPYVDEMLKMPSDEKIMHLSKIIREEKDFILFIDDFHLATEEVVKITKSVDHIVLSSRKESFIAKAIYLSGIDEEDREALIELFSTELPEELLPLPEEVKELISKIAE
ncbi:MAG: DUF4062 domain-containing protein, partial [Promethearchaeota archaeon]